MGSSLSVRWRPAVLLRFNVRDAAHEVIERGMDDVEATADYLSQLPELRLRRMATRLDPESAYARFKFATKLALEGQWEEARAELPVVVWLDSDAALANCLKAMLADHDHELDEAVGFARTALARG